MHRLRPLTRAHTKELACLASGHARGSGQPSLAWHSLPTVAQIRSLHPDIENSGAWLLLTAIAESSLTYLIRPTGAPNA